MTLGQAPWSAPPAVCALNATVCIPGSKSHTARALHLAALASAPSVLTGVLVSRDTSLYADALRALGAQIDTDEATSTMRVTPLPVSALKADPQETKRSAVSIDCGLAGTVMRFIPPLAALTGHPTYFDGDEAARTRPMDPLLEALRVLGAQIEYHAVPGHLPMTITGPLHAPKNGCLAVDASRSSQFLSALLLLCPLLDADIVVHATGPVVSLPHVRMSIETLRSWGIDIDDLSDSAWLVHPGRPRGRELTIEPDLSNAGVFLAATLLIGGTVRIPAWPHSTTQAGDSWRELLAHFGASFTHEKDGTLRMDVPPHATWRGCDVDLSALGELTPTLTALLLFASTPSRVRGIAHVRGHETDRIAALVTEIRRLGGDVVEHDDGFTLTPVPLHAACLSSYGDHRMATFGALVGLRVPGVTVRDIECTSKTLPNFPRLWSAFLSQVNTVEAFE